jgi:dTDP-4-amino-4,6-dideoxygalactose transaminase
MLDLRAQYRPIRETIETLALPIYGELTDDQLRYVVDMVGKALEQ